MIEAEGLTKRYGQTQALAGIDLEVPAGTDPRRARTQRGRQDHRRPDPHHAGRPDQRPRPGRRLRRGHPGRSVRRSIGVTAQDATLDDALTGRQNLVMIGELSGLSRRPARAAGRPSCWLASI